MKKIVFIIPMLLIFIQSGFTQNVEAIKDATPFAYSGAFATQAGFYHADGIANRAPNTLWSLSGNLNFTLYDQINLPFAFTFGRYGQASSYPTFGQIGLSPSYKWATVHLGHRNMTFSPYTLAGHTFLGAGVELNPGILRFSAMYGKLRNAAEVDTTQSFIQPTFKRVGYGIKLGVGKDNSFIDFMVFKAKDEKNSLTAPQNKVKPAENIVFGMSAQMPLFKTLTLNYDIGASIFTRNQNSQEVLLDDLSENFDKYLEDSYFEAKASTRANLASKASLNYRHPKLFRLKIEYERIDPQYETMGAYFFANDLERLTVAPNFNLFKNKVSFNGNYGIQRNNLLGDRLETTQRSIGSANIDVHPNTKFGVNLNFSNYSIYQEAGRQDLNDTIAFNLATTTIGMVPRFNFQSDKTIQSLLFNFNYQKANQDNDLFFGTNQNFESILLSVTHSLVFPNSAFNLNTGANYNTFSVAGIETELIGGTLGLNIPVFDKKLNLSLSNSFNVRRVNKMSDGSTLNSYFSLNYSPTAVHSLGLNLGWLKNFSSLTANYSEFRGGVVYTFIIPNKKKK